MLATKREEIIARRAKVKQKEHGGTAPGKKKNTSGKIAESVPISTRKQSAAAAGVGERTYDAGKLILKAAEEIIARRAKEKKVVDGRNAALEQHGRVSAKLPKPTPISTRAESAKAPGTGKMEHLMVAGRMEHLMVAGRMEHLRSGKSATVIATVIATVLAKESQAFIDGLKVHYTLI